jgi:hypothetical protein
MSMLRAILILAAICAPVAAQAGPIVSFVGFLTTSFSVTATVSAGFAFWSTGFGAAALRVVGALALSAVSARLNRPQMPAPQDQMTNQSQPLSAMVRIYGRVRRGGPIGFTGFKNSTRYYAVMIAAHRTLGPVEHWLDTRQITVDGSGAVITDPMTGHGKIRTYTGQAGQAADAGLMAAFPEVTSDYDFAGLSYAVLEARKPSAENFSAVYPQGKEWAYAPLWDGHDAIYDPRNGTYDWSDNAALIIAQEAIFHGKAVDWDEVAIEAAICDELVSNADGGLQKRWTINVSFDDSVTWESARATLAAACDAWFYERPDGLIGFKVGRYIAPSITLTDRDFIALANSEKAWGPDVAGEFTVGYVEPSRDHRESITGAIVFEAGLPRAEDQCYAINSHNQGCRVAKRLGTMARAQFAVRGTIKLIGYDVIGQRFVRITSAALGFDLVIEIDKLSRDAGALTFSFDGHSVTAADFDFDGLTEEPPRPITDAVVSDDAVAAITGLSGAVVEGTGGVAQIEFTWPAQDESLTQELEIRSLDGGSPDWRRFAIASGQISYLAVGLVDGATYDAQIRNRTVGGRVSAFSAIASVQAVANTTAPGALVGFAVIVDGGNGLASWTAPNDGAYLATRIYRGPTSTFGDAALLRTEYGAPNTADSWTDTAPAAGDYYYWAEAINGSGIAGPRSGPEMITII